MNYYNKTLEFAKENIAPIASEIDHDMRFPNEIFEKLGEESYLSLIIPEEKGGQGKGLLEHVEVCMGLSEYSATIGLCYMMHNVALNVINMYGSKELQNKIYEDVLKHGKYLTLAYSEFGSGTHFYKPETTMIFDGNDAVINGIKSMVTSAEYASYYLVLTKSTKDGEISNFVIPKDTENLSFVMNFWDGLGMRGNVSCPMEMKDIRVSKDYMIGNDGDGMLHVLTGVAPMFIAGLAAVYTGLSLDMCDFGKNYAMERKYPDGITLSEIETVQIHISELYTKSMAAKSLTFEAAKSANAGDDDALLKILAARIFASETAVELGNVAMRIGGGKAYNKKLKIERLLRDAYASQIMAPSVDVLKIWLGKASTDQQIP